MSDMRSPLAMARDKWLESEEGKRCSQVGTLSSNPTYLINRLVCAFLAGSNSAPTDGLELAEMVIEREDEMRSTKISWMDIVAAARALREKASGK